MKRTLSIILLTILVNYSFADEAVKLRDHIVKDLCKNIKVDYKSEPTLTIWHQATPKIVKVPKYKSGNVYIDKLKMIPEDKGWVMRLYGPYKLPFHGSKIWAQFFDNTKDQIEMTMKVNNGTHFIGVTFHYGKLADKSIIQKLKKYK